MSSQFHRVSQTHTKMTIMSLNEEGLTLLNINFIIILT